VAQTYIVCERQAPESMRALIVEDDQTIAGFVAKGLREAGFVVDVANDGVSGLALARTEPHDIAIVDLMLPGLDGMSLIQSLRRDGIKTPVLILSAKQSVDDRVKGLETGADDYLTKPFAFSELLARVQALIRRATAVSSSTPSRLSVGDLTLDVMARRAVRAGREIELRPREFTLLEYLMRNAGRVVSKTMILSHVWDYAFDPRTNVVDVLVFRLREKIDKEFPTKLIHTVRGIGYVLKVD
jgi:two-component system OmpR family response regulator